MAPKESSKLTMKLLVESKTQRVLYAEAGKDVVDFLFSLLTLPVGTVVKLLTTETMVGSVGNLYGSMEKLDDTYIGRDDAKKDLLTPAAGCQSDKLLQLEAAPPEIPDLYSCGSYSYQNCKTNITRVYGAKCKSCHNQMTLKLVEVVDPAAGSVGGAVSPAAEGAGFVQGIVTYTVMDDLKVSPMSSISGITLLNTFGVTDIGSLQEKTVQLGYDEVTNSSTPDTNQLFMGLINRKGILLPHQQLVLMQMLRDWRYLRRRFSQRRFSLTSSLPRSGRCDEFGASRHACASSPLHDVLWVVGGERSSLASSFVPVVLSFNWSV